MKKTETSSVMDHLSPAATGGKKMEVSVTTSAADSKTYCGKNTMVKYFPQDFHVGFTLLSDKQKNCFISVSTSAETPV